MNKLTSLDELLDVIENFNGEDRELIDFIRDNAALGVLIDAAFQQREIKRAADKAAKHEESVFKYIERAVLNKMEQQGTEDAPLMTAGGLTANCSITIEEQPTVKAENWPEVWKFIVENDACYLLQKRISASAWRELGEVPGIEPFEQKKLSLRRR